MEDRRLKQEWGIFTGTQKSQAIGKEMRPAKGKPKNMELNILHAQLKTYIIT